jgi:uncharacterized MAPEG superfamily protein
MSGQPDNDCNCSYQLVHCKSPLVLCDCPEGWWNVRWTASARDHELAPLTGVAGRLDRALRNFSETFPLFAALLLAAQAIGRHSWLTEAGAILYFFARLAYLPLYVFGVPIVRSLVWNVAALGMALLLVAIFWE